MPQRWRPSWATVATSWRDWLANVNNIYLTPPLRVTPLPGPGFAYGPSIIEGKGDIPNFKDPSNWRVVRVIPGTTISITAYSVNAGGVKDFQIRGILLNGQQNWIAKAEGVPQINTGKVPDVLEIPTAAQVLPTVFKVSDHNNPSFLEVQTQNFNGQWTRFQVQFLADK